MLRPNRLAFGGTSGRQRFAFAPCGAEGTPICASGWSGPARCKLDAVKQTGTVRSTGTMGRLGSAECTAAGSRFRVVMGHAWRVSNTVAVQRDEDGGWRGGNARQGVRVHARVERSCSESTWRRQEVAQKRTGGRNDDLPL